MVARGVAIRAGVCGLALVVWSAGAAWAQTGVDSFANLSQVLERGTIVFVQDETGQRAKGKIADLSDTSLRIVTSGAPGRTLTFNGDHVTRVSRVDSRLNGFLIGIVAGAVPGLWLGHGLSQWCENESGRSCWASYPYFGGLGALAGGWIGFAIDGAIDGQTVVFARRSGSAPRLSLTAIIEGRARGARLSWRF